MSVWKLPQSNLGGRRARFLIGVRGQCSTDSKDLLSPNNFVAKRSIQWLCQSTSFSEAGSIRHRKKEGLQPSLIALFNAASSPALEVLTLY